MLDILVVFYQLWLLVSSVTSVTLTNEPLTIGTFEAGAWAICYDATRTCEITFNTTHFDADVLAAITNGKLPPPLKGDARTRIRMYRTYMAAAHEYAHVYMYLNNRRLPGYPRPLERPKWVSDYCWQNDAEWYACNVERYKRLR